MLDRARYGGAARRALGSYVTLGGTLWLEYDVTGRDRAGHLLADVWTGARGGVLVNAAVVAAGYADARPMAPDLRHAAVVRAARDAARAAGCGLWTGGTFARCVGDRVCRRC